MYGKRPCNRGQHLANARVVTVNIARFPMDTVVAAKARELTSAGAEVDQKASVKIHSVVEVAAIPARMVMASPPRESCSSSISAMFERMLSCEVYPIQKEMRAAKV